MTHRAVMSGAVTISRHELHEPEVRALIAALDAEIVERYPEDRTADHFRLDPDEVAPGRGAFLVARSADGAAIGCGAVRLLEPGIAEIKRMFVVRERRGRGAGALILAALESEARRLGAVRLLLETGPRQPEAIALYARSGFVGTDAFGEYQASPLSRFMEKILAREA